LSSEKWGGKRYQTSWAGSQLLVDQCEEIAVKAEFVDTAVSEVPRYIERQSRHN
jgi:hypothetical protein